MAPNVDDHRNALRDLLRPYKDTISRARRAYFDRPSHALSGKHEVEFNIKRSVADRYRIPFRSVVFTGSAQLGFSSHKDTEFVAGASDLDIACIDTALFQKYWESISSVTQGFQDDSKFINADHAARLKDQILRRGMILLDYMPTCVMRTDDRRFFDQLSSLNRGWFNRISAAIYLSEYAFCWKQASALKGVMGVGHAE